MLEYALRFETADPNVTLREFATVQDDKALVDAVQENWRYSNNFGNRLAYIYPSVDEATLVRREREGTDQFVLGIWLNKKELLGLISTTPDADRRRVQLGYMVREKYRGNEYAALAVQALSAFLIPDYEEVYAMVSSENRASARVLEKSGFVLSGQDEWHDVQMDVYSLTK